MRTLIAEFLTVVAIFAAGWFGLAAAYVLG